MIGIFQAEISGPGRGKESVRETDGLSIPRQRVENQTVEAMSKLRTLMPPEQGKRVDREPVRNSDKLLIPNQRLSEFRKLKVIAISPSLMTEYSIFMPPEFAWMALKGMIPTIPIWIGQSLIYSISLSAYYTHIICKGIDIVKKS